MYGADPIKVLLKAGADINWKSRDGKTILDNISYLSEKFGLLKEAGFDFSSANQSSIEYAL